MNFESINNIEDAEVKNVFDTGIDIDDEKIFETLSEDERRFIIENRDLFEQFNNVRSRKQASEIIKSQTQIEDGSIENAKEMYDLVKRVKEVYSNKNNHD